LRIIFMGTPEISLPVLRAVAKEHEVAAVYTRPDASSGRGREVVQSPVKKEALQLGIPVMQPANFKDSHTVSALQAFRPELILVVAYGVILPKTVLAVPPLGAVNVHFSILPRYRGASPVAGAILAGDRFTGVSIMLMEAGIDTGPVLSVSQVPIFSWDNTLSLSRRLAGISGGVTGEVLAAWRNKEIVPRLQDGSRATYSGIIRKEDGAISWEEEAGLIWRKAKAYFPWPGIYTTWRGKILKLTEVEPVPYEGPAEPGQVVKLEYGADICAGVATGKGLLGIRRIQLEGKKEVTITEFVRGQREFIGSILPD
jgi:methionyl-tRNA formyltransferase